MLIALKRAQTGYDELEAGAEDQSTGVQVMSLIISYSRLQVARSHKDVFPSKPRVATCADGLLLRIVSSILVSVYTHLLLINNTGGHMFWSWLNIFITLSLWAVELLLSSQSENQANVVKGFRFKRD